MGTTKVRKVYERPVLVEIGSMAEKNRVLLLTWFLRKAV